MIALLVACGGGDGASANGGLSVATITPSDGATPANSTTVSPGTASGTPGAGSSATNETAELSGFVYPIEGACLPQGPQLMPNAPREYRQGFHEGIDFYAVDNCTSIGVGTPVIAAKAGTVIRVDHDYVELTPATLAALQQDLTSAETLDAFRGRQVWINHGGGVVTRYCHLNAVAEGLHQGDTVAQGEIVGYVGESGTPESISAPGSEYHLHFELRVGDSFLGAGLEESEVRALYLTLFSP